MLPLRTLWIWGNLVFAVLCGTAISTSLVSRGLVKHVDFMKSLESWSPEVSRWVFFLAAIVASTWPILLLLLVGFLSARHILKESGTASCRRGAILANAAAFISSSWILIIVLGDMRLWERSWASLGEYEQVHLFGFGSPWLLLCGNLLFVWKSVPAQPPDCPRCHSSKTKARVFSMPTFSGLAPRFVASIGFVTGVFLVVEAQQATRTWLSAPLNMYAVSGLALIVAATIGFIVPNHVCLDCNKKFLWPPVLVRKLKVRCLKCGKGLVGATEDMVGDVGVCPNCREEFTIPGP